VLDVSNIRLLVGRFCFGDDDDVEDDDGGEIKLDKF
jgi:hypothetical protein